MNKLFEGWYWAPSVQEFKEWLQSNPEMPEEEIEKARQEAMELRWMKEEEERMRDWCIP